jgi:hypothetical protein
MISSFTDSAAGPRVNSHSGNSAVGQTAASLRSSSGLSPVHAYTSNHTGLFRAVSTGGLVGQLWSPGLLDRLHEPLTRYRE